VHDDYQLATQIVKSIIGNRRYWLWRDGWRLHFRDEYVHSTADHFQSEIYDTYFIIGVKRFSDFQPKGLMCIVDKEAMFARRVTGAEVPQQHWRHVGYTLAKRCSLADPKLFATMRGYIDEAIMYGDSKFRIMKRNSRIPF